MRTAYGGLRWHRERPKSGDTCSPAAKNASHRTTVVQRQCGLTNLFQPGSSFCPCVQISASCWLFCQRPASQQSHRGRSPLICPLPRLPRSLPWRDSIHHGKIHHCATRHLDHRACFNHKLEITGHHEFPSPVPRQHILLAHSGTQRR